MIIEGCGRTSVTATEQGWSRQAGAFLNEYYLLSMREVFSDHRAGEQRPMNSIGVVCFGVTALPEMCYGCKSVSGPYNVGIRPV
jgi:hypothetical protein